MRRCYRLTASNAVVVVVIWNELNASALVRFLAFASTLCTSSLNRWHLVPSPWFKSSREEVPASRVLALRPVCSLSLSPSGLSRLHRRLGSNLTARGGVSCVGAVAQSICLHQWAGVTVGSGQQDPTKHQLLAACSTDSRPVGRIYSTASGMVRLEDLSSLSTLIWPFSHTV